MVQTSGHRPRNINIEGVIVYNDNMLEQLISGIASLSYWDIVTDFHGFLAIMPLILFGISLALYFSLDKFAQAVAWLKRALYLLVANLMLLDFVGLYIYAPYRAPGGPRTFLKSFPETAWLHEILFEHKEFLAYAPWLLALVALVIVIAFGSRITEPENKKIKRLVLFSLAASLIFVLIVASEAVLITKVAPLK